MSRLHYLTALLIVILLAIASGRIFESFEKSPILTKEKARHDPDYFLHNFTATTMNAKGMPAYKVTAEHLEHYPDDNSMKLQTPFISFYENNIKTKDIPAVLSAEQLTIEPKKEIAHTKSKINLRKGKNTIDAVGMRADLNKGRIEFFSNTRSHYVSVDK